MAKKDKSKFRKHIKAQIMQQMAQVQAQEKEVKKPIFQAKTQPQTEVKTAEIIQQGVQTAAIDTTLQNLPQIRYDLKKTAIVIGILAAIIAVLYILDLKYNILISFGNIIFRVLHIQ